MKNWQYNSLLSLSKVKLENQEIRLLCSYIRLSILRMCMEANSGHIGGSFGAVELLTTLYFGGILNIDLANPQNPHRDRVLVRGHLGVLRYNIFSLLGWLSEDELIGYRQINSRLPGHEDHLITPGVDITPTGSLGMLLSYGAGAAYVARKREHVFNVFVFLGDGEEQEGNISEAARHAAHLQLDNLIVILDANSKQLSDPVCECDNRSNVRTIWEGYGWLTIEVENGHDIEEIQNAYFSALEMKRDRPVLIIAKTIKGWGMIGAMEHFSGYHTIGTVDKKIFYASLDELQKICDSRQLDILNVKSKLRSLRAGISVNKDEDSISSILSEKVSLTPGPRTPNNPDECQIDYFKLLVSWLKGKENSNFYFLTADVTRRDVVNLIGLTSAFHYLNVGIREQHLVAFAHGISVTDPDAVIILNTLDAFTYRYLDQLNAMIQGKGRAIIISDVAGLTNARNGKTHQTSGQPGSIITMPGIEYLEPWDATDVFNCLNWALSCKKAVFIRIHRSHVNQSPENPHLRNIYNYVVYGENETPDVVIVSSGYTVTQSIAAAKLLKSRGIVCRVVNLINFKSNVKWLLQYLIPGKPLVTVYNGNPQILRDVVAGVILGNRSEKKSVPSGVFTLGFEEGRTGALSDITKYYGLDADSIAEFVINITSNNQNT